MRKALLAAAAPYCGRLYARQRVRPAWRARLRRRRISRGRLRRLRRWTVSRWNCYRVALGYRGGAIGYRGGAIGYRGAAIGYRGGVYRSVGWRPGWGWGRPSRLASPSARLAMATAAMAMAMAMARLRLRPLLLRRLFHHLLSRLGWVSVGEYLLLGSMLDRDLESVASTRCHYAHYKQCSVGAVASDARSREGCCALS